MTKANNVVVMKIYIYVYNSPVEVLCFASACMCLMPLLSQIRGIRHVFSQQGPTVSRLMYTHGRWYTHQKRILNVTLPYIWSGEKELYGIVIDAWTKHMRIPLHPLHFHYLVVNCTIFERLRLDVASELLPFFFWQQSYYEQEEERADDLLCSSGTWSLIACPLTENAVVALLLWSIYQQLIFLLLAVVQLSSVAGGKEPLLKYTPSPPSIAARPCFTFTQTDVSHQLNSQ